MTASGADADPGRALIEARIRAFCDAFNRDSLDEVMSFFTEDGVYQTLEGHRPQGKEAIRRAFEPQFNGAFGRMFFDVEDLIIDVAAQRAVLRWTCRHEAGLRGPATQTLLRVLFGRSSQWQGLDVFVLDGDRIREKHTFTRAWLPKFRRVA